MSTIVAFDAGAQWDYTVIDGTARDGTYQGDASQGPWVVFHVGTQQIISRPYRYRWMAVLASRIKGYKPRNT